jgi:hypothetical protein
MEAPRSGGRRRCTQRAGQGMLAVGQRSSSCCSGRCNAVRIARLCAIKALRATQRPLLRPIVMRPLFQGRLRGWSERTGFCAWGRTRDGLVISPAAPASVFTRSILGRQRFNVRERVSMAIRRGAAVGERTRVRRRCRWHRLAHSSHGAASTAGRSRSWIGSRARSIPAALHRRNAAIHARARASRVQSGGVPANPRNANAANAAGFSRSVRRVRHRRAPRRAD